MAKSDAPSPESLRPEVQEFKPYSPGLSIDEIRERYGLTRVVKLASNENPLGTSPLVKKAVERSAPGVFAIPPLRQSPVGGGFAERLGVATGRIVVGNGSDELIDLLIRAKAPARPGQRARLQALLQPVWAAGQTVRRGVPAGGPDPGFSLPLGQLFLTRRTTIRLLHLSPRRTTRPGFTPGVEEVAAPGPCPAPLLPAGGGRGIHGLRKARGALFPALPVGRVPQRGSSCALFPRCSGWPGCGWATGSCPAGWRTTCGGFARPSASTSGRGSRAGGPGGPGFLCGHPGDRGAGPGTPNLFPGGHGLRRVPLPGQFPHVSPPPKGMDAEALYEGLLSRGVIVRWLKSFGLPGIFAFLWATPGKTIYLSGPSKRCYPMTVKPEGVFTVTLDGPAGVGKSTIAKDVAEALGIAYLDTGAMFRATAWKLGEGGWDLPEDKLTRRLEEMSFTLSGSGRASVLSLNGEPLTDVIRTEAVGMWASNIGTVPVVREFQKKAQRAIAASVSLVAEGRDMGTVVFPGARFKVFLDAAPEERARRRCSNSGRMGKEADEKESPRTDSPKGPPGPQPARGPPAPGRGRDHHRHHPPVHPPRCLSASWMWWKPADRPSTSSDRLAFLKFIPIYLSTAHSNFLEPPVTAVSFCAGVVLRAMLSEQGGVAMKIFGRLLFHVRTRFQNGPGRGRGRGRGEGSQGAVARVPDPAPGGAGEDGGRGGAKAVGRHPRGHGGGAGRGRRRPVRHAHPLRQHVRPDEAVPGRHGRAVDAGGTWWASPAACSPARALSTGARSPPFLRSIPCSCTRHGGGGVALRLPGADGGGGDQGRLPLRRVHHRGRGRLA